MISGTPTAQLIALAEAQCITIQSLEKSNSHVCTKIRACVHTHMADTQGHTCIYIYILHTSSIGWIIIIIVLTPEFFKCH